MDFCFYLRNLYTLKNGHFSLIGYFLKVRQQISLLIQRVPPFCLQTVLKQHSAANLTLGSWPNTLRGLDRRIFFPLAFIFFTCFHFSPSRLLSVNIFFCRVAHFSALLIKSHAPVTYFPEASLRPVSFHLNKKYVSLSHSCAQQSAWAFDISAALSVLQATPGLAVCKPELCLKSVDKTSLALQDKYENTINGDKQTFLQSHILSFKFKWNWVEVQIQGIRHAVQSSSISRRTFCFVKYRKH